MLTHVGESVASPDTLIPPVVPLTSTFVVRADLEGVRGGPRGRWLVELGFGGRGTRQPLVGRVFVVR